MTGPAALALRSLRYYRWSHLPAALGVLLAAAVLTGALFVGDSLRGSLRARSDRQLNGVQSTLIAPRTITEETASKINDSVPALILTSSATARAGGESESRLGRIAVLGLRDADRERFRLPAGVVLSSAVATRLQITEGEEIELGLEQSSNIPRSSLLGKRDVDSLTKSIRVRVMAILPADHPMNDFNLNPGPLPPLNIFVTLAQMQNSLELKGKVNAILSFRGDTNTLNDELRRNIQLADLGLKVRPNPHRQHFILESDQLVIGADIVQALRESTDSQKPRIAAPTMTYLANAIYPGEAKLPNRETGDPKRQFAYSVVAALDLSDDSGYGPFPGAGTGFHGNDDGIFLVDWPESPLRNLKLGEPVTIAYFLPEMDNETVEAWQTLPFRGYIHLAGAADDPNLTPPFPGITDKPKIRGKKGEQWEAPFEINYSRIGPKDEDFWERHKATPKAYISPKMGEKLFGSRFGSFTSIRMKRWTDHQPPSPEPLLRQTIEENSKLSGGLEFQPTRERMLQASRGGTDFGAILLAFSFLLILAALLLVGLLMRLAVGRRAKEIGLLLATGYRPRTVGWMLRLEGMIVSGIGAALGILAAFAYAEGLLKFLANLWPDSGLEAYLKFHFQPESLAIGFFATLFVAGLTIHYSLRRMLKFPIVALLRGEAGDAPGIAEPLRRSRAFTVIGLSAALGILLVAGGGFAPDADQRAGAFFGGGGCLMLAGLLVFRWWLRRPARPGATATDLFALSLRNTTRAAGRSLLTAGLLALATFLLVAVESFRKRPDAEFAQHDGGSGGYPLIAETDVPVFNRFDREPGRGDVLDQLQKRYGGTSSDPRLIPAKYDFAELQTQPFRLHGGDDASCLNLYQAAQPRVLGANEEFLKLGRFRFAMTIAATPETKANPWLLLNEVQPNGAIPIIAEQNTVLWQLKTFVGAEISLPDENGVERRCRIVATLQDSIFSREVVMNDANFRKLFPHDEGYRYFLIEVDPAKSDTFSKLLETGLASNGLATTRSVDLVAAQQSVIGAYLTTFQLLGGLALLLGMLGFGVVILRNAQDRLGEFALLRAVGFTVAELRKLVLIESGLILAVGVGIGLLAAIISVLPNAALGGQLSAGRLGIWLVATLLTGTLVAMGATARVARSPVIPSLRRE